VPEVSDTESVERFRREAYAAARLSHRAIIRIFDLFELDFRGEATTGKPAALVIVMELLHGETLGDFLMKKGHLPVPEAVDLMLPLLSALAHAHRAGVVHRDLKPDNVFLATDPDDHVIPKILDFGVSKMASVGDKAVRISDSQPLTLEGVLLGTPTFMSPEQARGARDVDARSDVFSVGTLFYTMLAGKNPFDGEKFHAVVEAIVKRDPPRPPDLPDAIWEVLERALAKDVNARYADATELGIAFRRAAGRTSATDSGPHSSGTMPVSGRTLVKPLGGDSYVSVPPVGSADGADGAEERARGAAPAARRRAVRIVVAVVAASLALVVVALWRGPGGEVAGSSAGVTADAVIASSKTNVSANVNAGASASASASAGVPEVVIARDAGVVEVVASAKVMPAVVLPAPKSSGAYAPPAPPKPHPSSSTRAPSIVRDPGF
jgi:serine/threonine-protein kinase